MALRSSRNPSLAEVIRIAMEHRLSSVRVAMPAQVLKYDASRQVVEVQPVLQQNTVTPNGTEIPAETLPILTDVPVVFPRSGGFFVSFPVQEGDHVLLIVCDRSLDVWMSSKGGVENPVDLRMHDLSDAVAYPGLYPFESPINNADAEHMVIGKDSDGMQLKVEAEKAQFQIQSKIEQAAVIGEQLQSYFENTLLPALRAHTHPTGVGPSGPSPQVFDGYSTADVHSNHVKVPGNS